MFVIYDSNDDDEGGAIYIEGNGSKIIGGKFEYCEATDDDYYKCKKGDYRATILSSGNIWIIIIVLIVVIAVVVLLLLKRKKSGSQEKQELQEQQKPQEIKEFEE